MLKKNVIEKGQDNIFKDLQVTNPQEKQLKAKAALTINRIIEHRHLTQEKTADLLGLTQNKVSDLKRGKLRGFLLAKLFQIINNLDKDIEIRVRPKPKTRLKGITEMVA